MEYGEYAALYPEGPEESRFEQFDWEARRIMDRATTGVDGVHKLSAAPPTEPSAALAVARCEAALVRMLWRAEQEESYVNQKDGTVTPRVATAITAGSESVSFAAPPSAGLSRSQREAMYADTVREYLSGVPDANGVHLLYMGRYPRRSSPA